MRLARLTARVLPIFLALAAAIPARAQEPVREYTPAPRYSTFQLGAQVTGKDNRGRDVLLSWGKMRTLGSSGEWMPSLGLTAGFTSGRDFIGGVVAGPTVGFGYALPGQYMSFGRATRTEPYVLAQAAAYGIGRFRGELEAQEAGQDDGWGIAPAFAAGIGLRLFSDEWDVDLSTLEIVVEKRIGFGEDAAQLYIRFGRAIAPRERRDRGTDPGIEPAAVLPPPPSATTSPPPADTARRPQVPASIPATRITLPNRYLHEENLVDCRAAVSWIPRCIPDAISIRFRAGATLAERQAAVDAVGTYEGGIGSEVFVRIARDPSLETLRRALATLRALPQVQSANPYFTFPLDLNRSTPASNPTPTA